MITIEPEKIHKALMDLRAEGYDFLRSLTGMDWGEEGLGVIYHIEKTSTGENKVVKTVTANRENPELPSVCDIWKAAELNEREVYDFFGIHFIGHPDMRRLFLREDWVGHPFRKDYDESLNPLRMTNEEPDDVTHHYEELPDGSIIEKRDILFDEDEYIINIGPQHPATHGVLRFRVSLEGEIIKKLDVHCGYIHRGAENYRVCYLKHGDRHIRGALCAREVGMMAEGILDTALEDVYVSFASVEDDLLLYYCDSFKFL